MNSLRQTFNLFAASIYFLAALVIGVLAVGSFNALNSIANMGGYSIPWALGANSTGTLVGANIIQRALQLCFTRFPSLSLFSMGFKELDGSVAGAQLNQDVYSRIKTPSTVSNFESGATDFTMTDVPGKLRNFRQIHHRFTAAEINASSIPLIDQTAEPMAIGLAQAITASMVGLVSRSNFNLTVNSVLPYLSVASGWTYANTLVPLIGAANDRGIPAQNRFVVAGTAVNGALLTDTNIVAALYNSANAEAIKNGKLPQIMAGYSYDTYPAMAVADSNLIGFAGTPDALIYMARAPKSPDEAFAGAASRAPFSWGIITDPMTGFSVLVQQWIETNLAVNTRLVWLDGYQVGNPNNLVRIVNGVVAGTSGVPIAAAKVTNPGYGYKNSSGVVTAPTVTVVPVGAGSGATAVATVDSVGAVTGITISGGTGYTTGFTLTIAPSGGGRCDAPATATGTTSGLN